MTNESIERAGRINREVIRMGFEYATAGINLMDLDKFLGDAIRQKGGTPAFLGYMKFPRNACICLNDELVHGVAKDRTLASGDILTIDLGTNYQGWCADAAETHIVGYPRSADDIKLIEGSMQILYAVRSSVRAGVCVWDLAATADNMAAKFGLRIFPQLGGHGIGKSVHESPQILHTRAVPWAAEQVMKATLLQENSYICLEPIISAGGTDFYEDNDGWTLKTKDQSMTAQQEVMVQVTKTGCRVIS